MGVNTDLLSIRHSSSVLLAKVIAEMFPDAKFVDIQTDSLGFFCDVLFRKPIDQGALDQMSERLLQLTAQKLAFHSMTMMRSNASELLKHQGVKLPLPDLPLLEMLKIQDFCCPCPLPHLENSGQIGAVKLFPLEENEGVTRISGTAFSDQKGLKHHLKLLERYKKEGHLNQLERLNLATLKGDAVFWKEKGLDFMDSLFATWKQWAAQHSCQIISSPLIVEGQIRLSHLDSQRPLLEKGIKFAEWGLVETAAEPLCTSPFLSPQIARTATKTSLCSAEKAEEELISSLHSINEIIRMFDINTQWVRCVNKAGNFRKNPHYKQDPSTKMFEALSRKVASQSQIDFDTCEADTMLEHTLFYAEFSDLLGRTWTGPSIHCEPYPLEGKGPRDLIAIYCNLFGPVERLVALLSEGEGKLPSAHGQENRHRKGGN